MNRAVIIGARAKHDVVALDTIERWGEQTGRKLLSRDMIKDHYDMTSKPRKGDGVKAVRRLKDTAVVVACHLFSMDQEQPSRLGYGNMRHPNCDGGWMYTKENHKLLDLCLSRNIPLFVMGDQPICVHANLPANVSRSLVGTVRLESGTWHAIFLYERA